jgi:hypothetical protein
MTTKYKQIKESKNETIEDVMLDFLYNHVKNWVHADTRPDLKAKYKNNRVPDAMKIIDPRSVRK